MIKRRSAAVQRGFSEQPAQFARGIEDAGGAPHHLLAGESMAQPGSASGRKTKADRPNIMPSAWLLTDRLVAAQAMMPCASQTAAAVPFA